MKPPAHIVTTKPSPVWTGEVPKPREPKRRPRLIALGALLVVIGVGFGSVFGFYLLERQRLDSRPASSAVRATLAADLRRLLVFGPAMVIAGVPGVILLVLGLRKR